MQGGSEAGREAGKVAGKDAGRQGRQSGLMMHPPPQSLSLRRQPIGRAGLTQNAPHPTPMPPAAMTLPP